MAERISLLLDFAYAWGSRQVLAIPAAPVPDGTRAG
jgi:hypothetical protein